jgi:uncharacterized membrane protein
VSTLRDALLGSGHEVTFMPNHVAATDFPFAADGFDAWDVVVLSDIGSNNRSCRRRLRVESMPNRLAVLRTGRATVAGSRWSAAISRSRIEAKANYRGTPLADVLPVGSGWGTTASSHPRSRRRGSPASRIR